MAYLKQIDERHQKFLIKKMGILESLKQVPVLVLDCNEEFEQNPAKLDEHLQKLQDFLTTTQACQNVTFDEQHTQRYL